MKINIDVAKLSLSLYSDKLNPLFADKQKRKGLIQNRLTGFV